MQNDLFLKLRDKAYLNARSKGFFKDDYPREAYITAIHEELSEAFRFVNKAESLNKAPWLIYKINEGSCNKPDGVYFELTDAVIRLLSYCGYMGYEQDGDDIETDRPYEQEDIFSVINASHATLAYINDIDENYNETEIIESIDSRQDILDSAKPEIIKRKIQATVERNNELRGMAIKEFISRIELFIAESSETEYGYIELFDLIEEKLKYNSTRPQKHGNNMV